MSGTAFKNHKQKQIYNRCSKTDFYRTTKKSAKKSKSIVEYILRSAVIALKAVVSMLMKYIGVFAAVSAIILVIAISAAVITTPFGIFWSGQGKGYSSISLAVAQINQEYSAKITEIETENYHDSIVTHRLPSGGSSLSVTNWKEVVAVFACKVSGSDKNAVDVVTIDESKIHMLSEVFWDMNKLSYYVQTIHHSGSDDEDGWTEYILHITLTEKGYKEMPDFYHFNKNQTEALYEMMKPEYEQMLAELVGTYGGELNMSQEQIAELLKNMPSDISEERKAVVSTAYSLLGKVNYFWVENLMP